MTGLQKTRYTDSPLVCFGLSIPGGKCVRLCYFLPLICSLRCAQALNSQSMWHTLYETLVEFFPVCGIPAAGFFSFSSHLLPRQQTLQFWPLFCSLHWKLPLLPGEPLCRLTADWLQVRGRVREVTKSALSSYSCLKAEIQDLFLPLGPLPENNFKWF